MARRNRISDALESLHAAILRVETMVHDASDAVDRLNGPVTPAARRAFAMAASIVQARSTGTLYVSNTASRETIV
jgi:hypothetical protein